MGSGSPAHYRPAMVETEELVGWLEDVAPLRLAESWDNVGLLVEPGPLSARHARVALTIELTEATLARILASGTTFVVCYHPPIFSGLKSLSVRAFSSSLVARAFAAGVWIHSPHTALDATEGGMTEWLATALGPGAMRPILPRSASGEAHLGAGRIVELAESLDLDDAVARIKAHLGLSLVRVARSDSKEKIRTFAVCPGAGGSVFEKLGAVDLLLTGEMRHHDVASRVRSGAHVVLTDHTNSERGYLPTFAERMRRRFPALEVEVLESDRDPLLIL